MVSMSLVQVRQISEDSPWRNNPLVLLVAWTIQTEWMAYQIISSNIEIKMPQLPHVLFVFCSPLFLSSHLYTISILQSFFLSSFSSSFSFPTFFAHSVFFFSTLRNNLCFFYSIFSINIKLAMSYVVKKYLCVFITYAFTSQVQCI